MKRYLVEKRQFETIEDAKQYAECLFNKSGTIVAITEITEIPAIRFELTDTFGGESNYSWVRRDEYRGNNPESRLSVVRAAKKWAGFNGLKCRVDDFDDTIAIYPYGICQVLFINY